MIILPVNSNPNIRNLSHNAYYDCIMSADEYTGDLMAVFAAQNEYEVKSSFSSYKKENGVYSVFQKEKYKDSKLLLYKKIDGKFSEKICLYFQKTHYSWSGFNILFSNKVDLDYEKEEKSVIKLGHPVHEKMFLKINKHMKDKFNEIPQGELPIELHISYNNGQIIFKIKTKSVTKKYSINLGDVFKTKDLYFQIAIEPGENQYYNWIYNNNIQLIAYRDQYENLLLDYYNKPRKNYRPYISDYMFETFAYQNLFLGDKKNIIHLVRKFLNRGQYTILKIDQYYVKGSEEYRKIHHIHEMLLYGLDQKKKLVYMIGYLQEGNLGKVQLSYKDFVKGFTVGDEDNVYVVKYHPHEKKYDLSVLGIKRWLEAFLCGENSSMCDMTWLPFEQGVYGIDIYDFILQKTGYLNQFITDLRMSYTLYEHKCLMLERIKYLINKNILEDNGEIRNMSYIVERAAKIKNASAYYKMTEKRKIDAQEIKDFFVFLKKSERSLYKTIIKELDEYEEKYN